MLLKASTSATAAPLGARIAVSAGSMLFHRSGSGPSVVFLAGGGMSGLYYWRIHDLVSTFATSVVYDRLGLGWSDVVDLPRSGTQVTDDLRELLRVTGLPAPYVLVGHSLGGLYARLYAKRFGSETAGLVLLDPTHEDIVDYLPEGKAAPLRKANTDDPFAPEQLDAMRAAYRSAFERGLAGWPAAIRDPVLDQGFSAIGYRQSMREPLNLWRVFSEVRDAGPEPSLPSTIVAAMGIDTFATEQLSPEAQASLTESNNTKYRLYSHLATSLPRTTLRRLDDVGHSGLAWLRPEVIADAIHDIAALAYDLGQL